MEDTSCVAHFPIESQTKEELEVLLKIKNGKEKQGVFFENQKNSTKQMKWKI